MKYCIVIKHDNVMKSVSTQTAETHENEQCMNRSRELKHGMMPVMYLANNDTYSSF